MIQELVKPRIIKFGPANDKQKRFLESKKKNILLSGAVAAGKAQPVSAKVFTPTGYKLMGNLRIGDIICSPDGGISQVNKIHPQGVKQIYVIEFFDGSKTSCTEDHLWDCWISEMGRRKLRTTREIIRIMNHTKQKVVIPVTKPVLFIEQSLSVDPYIIGVLLGDGSLKHDLGITSADKEIINVVRKRLGQGFIIKKKKEYWYPINWTLHNDKGFFFNPLKEELKKLNLIGTSSYTKFVPEVYKYGSVNQRIELLQGLMDTDGTIDKYGKISFCSVSKLLAEGVQFIVRSLGGRATLNSKFKNLNDQDYLCYEVYIRISHEVPVFKLKRKLSRVRPYNGGKSAISKRIEKVYPDGIDHCQCISVSHPSGLYVTDDFTVTHNSLCGCYKGFLLNLKYPGNRGLICRKEARSLYGSTVRTLIEQVVPPEMIISFNQMKGELIHKTSEPGVYSTIIFCGLDKRADQTYPTKIGSTEYGWIFVDEGTEIDEGDWSMLNTRLRFRIPGYSDDDNDLIPRILFTATNPDSPFHWMYKYFFESDNVDREVILTNPYDNPYLPKDYLKSLEDNLFGVTRERLLFGRWVQAEGVVYEGFNPEVHVVNDDSFLFWGDYKSFLAGADSNFPIPRACVLIGVRGDGVRDVLDEFYMREAHVEELISWLEDKAKIFKRNILVFHDPSDPVAIDKINNSHWLSCVKAKNAVIPGISVVAGKFKNKQLFINKKCFNLIRELHNYHWVKGSEGDKPVKEDDHLCDSLRYCLYSESVPVSFAVGRFLK